MANNLVTQSLKILGKAVKDTGKEYTANLTAFFNDAKDVKNTITNSATDVADTYAKLKRTNITKAIHDWFYQEESDSEASIGTGDEFDAGMSTGDGEHKLDGEDTPTALTAESMINISNKQTNAMIKIGRRQTEQSVANTAEIVSSLNSRSAEMLTAVNNINKTLLGISSRLDKIIEFQAVPLTNQTEIDKGGLYQDGRLSLMRIYEQSKNNLMTTGPMSLITMGFDMLRSGQLGPAGVAKLGIEKLAQKITINGKSFDDWGKAFNEIVGTATQTAMNEMINTPVFKNLLRGVTSFDQDKDYHTLIPNAYDDKRAIFDGKTKMSIVNIIPQMLAKINQSISGQEYHLDNRGRWIAGPMKNEFNEVTRAAFSSGGLNDKLTSKVSNAGVQSIGKKIPTEDIRVASEALTMALVMYLHSKGDRTFTGSRIKTELGAQIGKAAAVLGLMGKGDEEYWTKVCSVIVMQLSTGMLSSAGFVANVNQSLQKMIDEATKFAQSGKENAVQAGKLTFEMAANQFLLAKGAPTDTPAIQSVTNNNGTLATNKQGTIVNLEKEIGKFSTSQYVGGIFYLLNRGINVRVEKGKKYPWVNLSQVRTDVKPFENDDTFGKLITQGLAGKDAAKSVIADSLGITEKKGFFSKLLENPALLLNTISNFFRTKGSNAFGGIQDSLRDFLGEEQYNKLAEKAGGIKDSITHDSRYLGLKGKATELKETITQALTDFTHNNRLINNAAYQADSAKMAKAKDAIKHFELNEADEDYSKRDEMILSTIKKYIDNDTPESYQYIEKLSAKIKNKTLKEDVDEIIGVFKKRLAGQQAVAEGNRPADIGAVLMAKDKSSKGDDEEKGILRSILGAVGRIGKFVGKMATRGMSNIFFGLKSIGQGLFGYDDYDPVKGIHYKNKGFIRNITTELVASMWRTTKALIGKAAGGDSIGGNRFQKWVDKQAGTKGTWLNKHGDAAGVNDYYLDGEGKLQANTAMTVADSLKHPIKAVTKSLQNFGQNLKYVGNKAKGLIEEVAEGFKEFGKIISDAIGKVKGAVSKGWDKFKSTKVGNFLTNNKMVRGFTSGFREAAAVRKRQAQKKALNQDRAEHPVQNEIYEIISDEGNTDQDSIKRPSAFSKILTFLKEEVYEKFLMGDNMTSYLKNASEYYEEELDEKKESKKVAKDEEKKSKKAEAEQAASNIHNTSANIIRPVVDSTASSGSWSTNVDTGGINIGAVNTTTSSAASYIHAENTVSGGGIVNHIGNTVGSIAKMFGGFLQLFGGLIEMISSIIIGMEGFQALTSIVRTIFEEGLKPLNDMFFEIVDMLKPITDVLTDIVSTIAETLVTLVESIIDVIQPLIEAIHPIIEAIFKILEPILKVITIILEVVLMPIKLAIEAMEPLFEQISYRILILSGITQVLCGWFLEGVGKLIAGIGLIVDKLSKSDEESGMSTVGKNMLNMAQGMKDQGMEDIRTGMAGILEPWLKLFGVNNNKANEAVNDSYSVQAQLGAEFGAGDVNNITNNNWTYTYGSGNSLDQHAYGSYMNMAERGCGPVVLADALGRRGGGNISPALLAATMTGAGTYDPRRGTSVAGMLATSGALGMGMRVGGVTEASINQASPSNPITVLGSGQGFGTRSGNNHYVNIVGTDGHGGAFVSNPMTGRVERNSTTNIVRNSKLGLYGSGDTDDLSEYGFTEEAESALERLRDITNKITGMFSVDNSERSKRKNEQKAKAIKQVFTEDKYNSLKDSTMDQLRQMYPKKEGESDAEYESRIKGMENGSTFNKILVSLASDSFITEAEAKQLSVLEGFRAADEAWNTSSKSMSDAIDAYLASKKSSASSSISGAEMTPYEPIRFTKTYLNKETVTLDDGTVIPAGERIGAHDSNGSQAFGYYGSPIHDFFNSELVTKIYGSNVVYTDGNGWFNRFGSPHDDEGVGTMGAAHEGVLLKGDLRKGNRRIGVPAITGGTITYITREDDSRGLGKSIKWRDSGGMYHWYMHLNDIPIDLKEGNDIKPGEILGIMGNTGEGSKYSMPVMRYVVTSAGPQGNTGDAGYVNPFTFWQFNESNNHGSYDKNSLMNGSFWSQTYENKFANSDYHNQAQKAGLTGAQEAMIAAIGIHEDSAKKLTGEKSLTTVTADYNGQTAFGIMNWIPDPKNQYVGATETKYGTTLAEQLPIMRKMYFDKNPEHDRARIVSSNYSQYSNNLQQVIEHSLALKPGDAWGPLAESDIAESMGHYVANALVPEGWSTANGLGMRIGTAIDAYNWMVEKGWIKANSKTGDGGVSVNGKFIGAKTNPSALASGEGYFSSDGGAVLADYGKPSITKTNIKSSTSGDSPLHEFFSKTGKGTAMSSDENWYHKRISPNSEGVGSVDSSLGEHGGVDIWWSGGSEGKELHATTGGKVNSVATSSSAGNNIQWVDDAGFLHWYMHMKDPPLVGDKDIISPGQLLGYAGNTGASGGAHLHYSIIDSSQFNGWSNSPGGVNPLMYFKNYNSAGPQTNANARGGLSFSTGETKQKADTTNYGKTMSNAANSIMSRLGSFGKDYVKTTYTTAGSGDSNQWANWLFGTDSDISSASNDVPAIDVSKLTDDSGLNAIQNFQNKFSIKADDSRTTDMLNRMSDMTFNVRAKRVEELLEILIAKVDGHNNDTSGQPLPNLFDEGIPEPVTRLSLG